MQVSITGRRIEITRALRDYTEQKLSRFSRYSFQPMEAVVRLSVEKYRHLAEIVLWVNGNRILAKEETDEMYKSIDGATEKIDQRLKKYKEKRSRHQTTAVRRIVSPKPPEPVPFKTMRPYRVPAISMRKAVFRLTTQRIEPVIFFDESDEKLKVLKFGGNGRVEATELVVDHREPAD